MTNPATVQDLTDRWRPLTSQETVNGTTFLDDAWRMLRRKFRAQVPDLASQITADQDLNAEVVRVLCTAVLRVMKNPDGKRSESIDDYTWQRDQSVSAGLLYISDEELADILPGAIISGRAWSIDPLANRDWTFQT